MHTSYVTPETPPDSLAIINLRIARFDGSVKTQAGEILHGSHFQLRSDSTFWKSDANTLDTMCNTSIRRVIIADHARGRIEGSIYGTLTGALAGAIIGAFFGELHEHSKPAKNPGVATSAMRGALIGMVPGAGLGLFIGNGTGSLIKIQFQRFR
jgi:hypothetical protein